ncbi:MAG: hypothetical protein MSG64_20155 [Pyrinomonadaceae bacterium MAG19_C2-C3]|nr:hypothetical protein [Pyrinomonadaceae bacterium MAG19_C2-C3]
MVENKTVRKDDDLIEWQFAVDYAEFALRINFLAITTLLEKARTFSDESRRKSICLSGLQLYSSSLEDFALLLQAFKEPIKGKHIHLTLGIEKGSEGSSFVPSIFKHYESARQVLDNLGFTSLNYEKLATYLVITEQQLEDSFKDFANTITRIGEYQKTFNDWKNRLKHGKAVVENDISKPKPDHVLFLKWIPVKEDWELHFHWVSASLGELESATTNVAKLYVRSVELLWYFMLHYYPEREDKFRDVMMKCSKECVEQVRDLGLPLRGLA